jgi:hypothetical protein
MFIDRLLTELRELMTKYGLTVVKTGITPYNVGFTGEASLLKALFDPGATRMWANMDKLQVCDLPWKPIDSHTPRGCYLLLRGPSGYMGCPHRYIVAKHAAEFRPLQPWVDHAGDTVTDGGPMPTEWVEL